MYILNIVSDVKDNDNHKTQNFVYENYYRQIGFPKETVIIQFNENSEEKRFAIIWKKTDLLDTKHYCKTFLKNKKVVSNKIRNIYSIAKNFKIPKYCWQSKLF